jgi:hypothetical protein
MKALLIILALAAALPAAAVENVGPAETHGRETSEAGEFSVKPLKIYSPRGRRDPFVAQRFGVTGTARPETVEFTISGLRLTGFVGIGDHRIAMFKLRNSNLTYMLRSNRLYSAEDKRVAEVSGRILKNDEVELRQGERRLVFGKFRTGQQD